MLGPRGYFDRGDEGATDRKGTPTSAVSAPHATTPAGRTELTSLAAAVSIEDSILLTEDILFCIAAASVCCYQQDIPVVDVMDTPNKGTRGPHHPKQHLTHCHRTVSAYADSHLNIVVERGERGLRICMRHS